MGLFLSTHLLLIVRMHVEVFLTKLYSSHFNHCLSDILNDFLNQYSKL